MSSIPNPEEVWMKSTVTEEELEKMVEDQRFVIFFHFENFQTLSERGL